MRANESRALLSSAIADAKDDVRNRRLQVFSQCTAKTAFGSQAAYFGSNPSRFVGALNSVVVVFLSLMRLLRSPPTAIAEKNAGTVKRRMKESHKGDAGLLARNRISYGEGTKEVMERRVRHRNSHSLDEAQ
ncbi:hypothetical protein EVAR_47525_1 [Eumeta japonica]|uniref:Uncharacterized protein n=1 Tax=Eumeta variegata TaxID=151549 RepID=A0A4C1XV54_EUMVA|nr:hypothetical protein EVAR_47525_1 [Eumeta japonica]